MEDAHTYSVHVLLKTDNYNFAALYHENKKKHRLAFFLVTVKQIKETLQIRKYK